MSLTITILTENLAGGKFLAEHGLSYLIEQDGFSFLFDTGHSDVFLKNATQLGINIRADIKTVVLSHGHWDHGDGLRFIENKTLITHPGAFIKRYRASDNSSVGLAMDKTEIERKFKLITSRDPYRLSDSIFFLGEIPRLNDFESKSTAFIDENGHDDFISDDSALAIIEQNELFVITGCSHSGICNIIEHAKKVTGINNVKAVIGGFHLRNLELATLKTKQYFESQSITSILPSHCTELPALAQFYNKFIIKQVKTGMILNFLN